MADTQNGAAPNFNDRRGQNPYQPVSTAVQQKQFGSINSGLTKPGHVFYTPQHFDSYIGRGTKMPNGALPPTVLNGRIFPRENPDTAGLQRKLIELGEVR